MKRKLLSLALALALCLGLAVPAFAMSAEEGVSAIQVDIEVTEVEREYSLYTESCTAGYTAGKDQKIYNSMKSGTPITVTNVSTDPTAIVYVYYHKYNFITTPTEVYDPETSYTIQNVYYGNDFNYALTDRNDHPYYSPEDYTASINGLYWRGSDAVDVYMAEQDFKVLHSGESVTFTLPDPAGADVMYTLYANVYYPNLDDGEQNCFFYKWYNIKVEDSAPAGPSAPSTPSAPAQSATAAPTSAPVLVNGETTAFDAYEINDNNYFKLRDLAYVLSGTGKQFEVTWDAAANAIVLTSGKAYTAVGGEMSSKGAGNQTAEPTTSKILLDGKEVALTAYEIGGNNYFKLRDIGAAFDFGVDWDAAAGTIRIDTSKGYTSN